MVRQRPLEPPFGGSNPPSPAIGRTRRASLVGGVGVLSRTDFRKFKDFSWNPIARLGHAGIYRGDAFEKWLRGLIGQR